MNKKMRRLVVRLCGTTALCVPLLVHAQTSPFDPTLQQLYRTAEAHNATLQSARSALTAAQAGIETARMAKLPEVSAQVSVSYLGNGRLWNRKFGESTSAPMPHYGNNFLLRAEQVLYAGGAIKSSMTLASQQAQMAGLTIEEERQRVRFALASLYLQLHCLRNRQRVYATNQQLAQTQIELMHKRRAQGVSLRNDVTRYELQLQQMVLGERTMHDQQSILAKQLATALGTDSVAVMLLADSIVGQTDAHVGVEAEWQQLAMLQHLGLQKSALAVDINRTQERMARADRLPKVALVSEDHLDGPITIEVPPINKNFNYWYVGVGVSYNFSSLYKAKRKIKQSQLNTTLAQDQLSEAQQGVSDGVHAAYVNLGTARTELATCLKSVQLATENYEVVSNRYQNGLAIITDLTDAANMKLEAELALANARINVWFNYYNLKYVAHNL